MSPQPENPVDRSRTRRARRATGDKAMQRATLMALAVGLLLDAVIIVLAATRGDQTAVLGALIGTGLTLVMVLPTVGITFLGTRLTPVSMAATVLGSWAVKIFVVILVVIAVRDLASVSSRWIGLALLVGAVSAVIVEGVLLVRARQPLNVEPHTVAEKSSDPADGA